LGGCSPNGESAIEFTPQSAASTFITTTATNIELYPTTTSVIGRSCVVSQSEIDYNALVAGVIGVAEVESNPAAAYPSENPTSGFVFFTGTTGTYGDNRGINGTMYFTMLSSGRMSGYFQAEGLTPSTVHGLHVHLYGDMSSTDATSAGGHFNPGEQYHAGPDVEARHEGDMGNVTASSAGVATLLRTFDILSFTRYNYSILGHAVVLHTIRDDGNPLHEWTSTGAAGGRLAFGIIGYSARSSPFIATDSSSSTMSWKLALAYVGIGLAIVLVIGTGFYCCCKRRPSSDYHGI
jgi:Cu-Zn family superoxide dismutase